MKKKTVAEIGKTTGSEKEHKVLVPNSRTERRSRAQCILLSANSAEVQLNEIEAITVAVRNEVLKLDRCSKTKRGYVCSLVAVLNWFNDNDCHTFSKPLLERLVDDLHNDYVQEKCGRYKYNTVRKAAAWLCEFRETGKISQSKLNAYGFKYVNNEYEALISEYILYSLKMGLLKESSIKAYSGLVRRFFRIIEGRQIFSYELLTLPEVSSSIVSYSTKNGRSTGSMLDAMRSFARFISETHPEFPKISAALIGIPAHHKRVYEGFSQDDALKILNSVDKSTEIGKRDYAMMLLAYNTGLRGVDITNLRIGNIDWSSSEIRLVQQKTGIPIALPFDNDTGNAIADYILNGRPDSDCNNIFLRTVKPYIALSSQSPWTIFSKYSISALGNDYKGKHGPHAFRRSIGARMLEAGVPSEIMSDILGHSSPFALYQYTSVPVQNLRQCAMSFAGIQVAREELL